MNSIKGAGAETTGRFLPGTSSQGQSRPFQAAASRLTPNGSHTNSKAPTAYYGNYVPRTVPIFARWAHGSQMIDSTGKTYIDMLMALGAVTLGYRHPAVHNAVRRALADGGGVYSLPSQQECKTGELILEHVAPWAEQVRFVKTGSEAVHGAYRIAKRATGRDRVVIGNWDYHGWHEWCDNGDQFETAIRMPFVELSELFRRGDSYEYPAAVIIEPDRWTELPKSFMEDAREYCDLVGAILVFDEMIYGFRHALGGATEICGVTPDLACYGKGMANGMACACVVGKADIMQHADVMSGTYSGDTTGLAAAAATIQTYADQDVIGVLDERGRQLWDGLTQVFGEGNVEGRPAHLRAKMDEDYGYRFAAGMAARGVLYHPACCNVSAAHTKDQIDQVIEAVAATHKELQ